MKRIFAWITDTAGCFWYRIYLPLTALPANSYQYAWGAPEPDIGDYDIIIGQRIAGHMPGWLDLCANSNLYCIYDIDDDLLNIDPENTVPYSIYAPIADDTRKNIAAADLVTCSTDALADRLANINPNVTVLPNCVPASLLDLPDRRPPQVTVGWAGSMFHGQDWTVIPARLAELATRQPSVGYHMIGADYTAGAVRARVTGWGPIDHYYRALDFHIGIAPLQITPFNICKSWIKLVEYSARGIVPVAADIGQYQEWIDNGANGLLVSNPDAWTAALEYLVIDDTARHRMAAEAKVKARTYTIENQIGRWIEVYT